MDQSENTESRINQLEATLRGIITSPAWIAGYVSALTLVLGWKAHKEYLNYFGIDAAGIDDASAETTMNYLAYGVRAFGHTDVQVAVGVFLVFTLIWLSLPSLAGRVWDRVRSPLQRQMPRHYCRACR